MKWLLWLCLLPSIAFGRGLSFSEEMHGYAYWQGEFRDLDVFLDVTIQDIDAWRRDPARAATVTGWLIVDDNQWHSVRGTLNILSVAPGDEGRLLSYALADTSLKFVGTKHVYDDRGVDALDDMTTLRGALVPASQSTPSAYEVLRSGVWSSELRFEWWDPSTLWNFAASITTIGVAWYQELEVRALFLRTVLGSAAEEFFPWLVD